MGFRTIGLAAAAALTLASSGASAATLIVDVTNAIGTLPFGGTGNTRQAFTIGAGARVTAIAYDVTLTANSPSYLSEASVALYQTGFPDTGIEFNPGGADDLSGTATYSGAVDLTTLGLDFAVGGDGILRLEYFDLLADGGLPDSIWNSGTITVTYDAVAAAVPEPATWGMMVIGLGIVGGTMRRRARVSFSPSRLIE